MATPHANPDPGNPPLGRRALLRGAAALGTVTLGSALSARPAFGSAATPGGALATGPYQATWASVDQHLAAPEWFQDAKFGIYFHWGVFSTPAFYNEWYPREMYQPGTKSHDHHIATYGDPSVWPYNNFITGAQDKSGRLVQFAPRLKSSGGNFDPDAWAQLFVDAGAKFAGPVAEHHDGFSMWNSSVNEWNSVRLGPKLDLLQIFSAAIRGKGLKLLAAMHHAYNFNGYYQYAPRQSSASLQKLFGQLPSAQENQLWYDKLKEVIDRYGPDIIWEDFDLTRVDEQQRLNFLSYYYNQAGTAGKDVVATYKDGYDNKGEVFDYERGGPAGLTSPYWLTDDCVSGFTWCYTQGISYYSAVQMLHSLIDRVSKNGNMLLNIAPTADGTIPQGQQDLLRTIGGYLKQAGESIYATRAWSVFGEGPTQMGGGSFSAPRAGTNKDIRFTRNKAGNTLYATVLGWPGNGAALTVATLAKGRIDLGTLKSVQLLAATPGSYIDISLPSSAQSASGLSVPMPAKQPHTALAYVVKFTFSGQIPALDQQPPAGGYVRLINRTNGLALDGGGKVPAGSTVKQWTWDGSTNLQWQSVDLGTGYHRLVNRTNSMVLDGGGATAAGSVVVENPWSGSSSQQWRITDSGGGYSRLVNRATGLALDGGGAVASGSNAKQWTPDDSPNLQWQFIAS